MTSPGPDTNLLTTGRKKPKVCAVNRYGFEAQRHSALIDAQLAKHRSMLGDTCTSVDMAVSGWARAVPFVLGAEAWTRLANVKRLLDEIKARAAAQRAEALKTKPAYKAEMDDASRKVLFPQNARLATPTAA